MQGVQRGRDHPSERASSQAAARMKRHAVAFRAEEGANFFRQAARLGRLSKFELHDQTSASQHAQDLSRPGCFGCWVVQAQPPHSSRSQRPSGGCSPSSRGAADHVPAAAPARAGMARDEYQSSTRKARRVFQRLGRPCPSSVSTSILPGY